MLTVNAGASLRKVVKLAYRANLPVLVEGPHGVGKSEIIKQATEEIGINYICRDLSLMEPPDLVGMPQVRAGKTHFAPPHFLPSSGKGILVFEELNRCPSFMRAPCLQLLTDRSLNDYRLPGGWVPMAAINPGGDDYDVADLDPAILSRFVRVAVRADREEWLAWAEQHNVHRSVVDYVRADLSVFDGRESNPRAWKYVSNLLSHVTESPAASQTFRVAVSGLVGVERAAAFLAFLGKAMKPLTANQILGGERLASIREWVEVGHLDLVHGSILDLQKHLQAPTNFAAAQRSKNKLKNLQAFMAELPGDLRQQVDQFLAERDYRLPQRRKAQ